MMTRPFILLLGALACALSLQASAAASRVKVSTLHSVDEMKSYVENVDRRLQKGRYDVIDDKKRVWIIEQIAAMRKALDDASPASAPSADLIELASEFETGMIEIEEGGIVCRNEQRTGSRMREQKCYSQQRLREERERAQRMMQRSARQWPIESDVVK